VPERFALISRRLLRLLTFVALASLIAGASTGHRVPVASAGYGVRAMFLYLGPIDSNTWSYAHEQGRIAAGGSSSVQTSYMQSVKADDAEAVIRGAVAQGYNAIFATSFDFADTVLKIAPDYPQVVFEQATGVTTAPNVGTYDGRIYQGWYLAGMAAGATTKSNMIGYVAPLGIPEVVRDMNAFTLGARSVNPAAQVYPAWLGTFFDPPRERSAAEQLIQMGADVVARESDSTEPERAAAERGIWAIAYNAIPPGDNTPNLLTAPIWHWDVFYKKELEDLANGSWSSFSAWWGVPEGLVDIAPLNPSIPATAQAQISAKHDALRAASFDVFAGPLRDNAGIERVPPGGTLNDAQLLSLDWLVEGLVGTIPPQ
jgi:basic membrane protein A and related proteins